MSYMVGRPGNSTNYYLLSGTSMATPVVSGAAALLLQAQPGLSPDTVKARLMIAADKWADPTGNGDPCTYGAGYLDIPAALTCPYVATQYAMSPDMSEDSSGNVNLDLDSNFWGQRALWGTGLTNVSSIYGQRALWGTNSIASSRALWGTGGWSLTSESTVSSMSLDLSSTSILVNGE
jgi:serine protease AprX